MKSNPDNDDFINEEQLENKLNIPKGALRRRRHRGLELPYIKLGSSIRYHWPTVRAFLLNSCSIPVSNVIGEKTPHNNKRKRQRRSKQPPALSPNVSQCLRPLDVCNASTSAATYGP